jgi:hypothetical protein
MNYDDTGWPEEMLLFKEALIFIIIANTEAANDMKVC